MKKISILIACLILSLLTIGVMAQVSTPENLAAHHKFKTFASKAPYQQYKSHDLKHSLSAFTYYNLNYDSADAITNSAATHYDNQGQLMNAHYTYPIDTIGGNFDCINWVDVAFDSIFDPYYYSDTSYAGIAAAGEVLYLDTIVVPIVQLNYSGTNDTLDISLNEVTYNADSLGYAPGIAVVIKDTMIIGQELALSSDNLINYVKWGVGGVTGYQLSNPRFSVRVTYKGSKLDSCWFIYGFAGYSANCQGTGPYTLANRTTWSPVDTSRGFGIGTVLENSFLFYNQFAAFGETPGNLGGEVYYDCNSDNMFDAGDAVQYQQNVYVWALVHTGIPTGINNINAAGLSVMQNYPNPFNKETQIGYSLTKSSNVTFSVYDVTGREIMANNYNLVAPGQHIINLGANSFSPGIYFYTFNVDGAKVTKRMVITE